MMPGPRPLPLLGNLLGLSIKRLHLDLEKWARRYGDVYVFRLGPKPVLVISDTALLQQVLRDRPEGFRRLSAMREVVDEIRATGVFTAEGDTWSRQRRLVMAAFGTSHLREGHASIAEITRRLGRLWQGAAERGEPVDVLRDLTRYTVDITSVVGFGTDMNTIERGTHALQRHLEVVFRMVSRRMNMPFPLWRYVKLRADRELDRSLAEVEQVILDLIRKTRAEIDAEPARAAAPRNLLEAMLSARDASDPSARLSDREVFGNVFTLLLAGEDTTANTLAWMLYFMATSRGVQGRMQAEADALLGGAEVLENHEDIPKLRYTTAVAHETLRLKSAAPVQFCEAGADTRVGDVEVPAGTAVILLTRLVALRDENFYDAATFDPTRWLGAAPPGGRHEPRAALAFGSGPRVCPGRALSLIECGMVGAMVARRFDVSLEPSGAAVEERFAGLMRPEGLRIRLTPRRRS
jgi:cytochrome P450